MSNATKLVGEYGHLTLNAAGGMIGPARFDVRGVGPVSPLTCPQWGDRDGAGDWLPLLRNLCGDFICAPSGAPEMSPALPPAWRRGADTAVADDPWFHGYGANNRWEIVPDADDRGRATMTCRPPPPHPFALVSRTVGLLAEAPGYACELSIAARADVRFSLCLHPCFVLPDRAGSLKLEIPSAGRGWTYPVKVVPDHAPIAVDQRFDSLEAVPRHDGGVADLSRLPPAERCEILVQIPAPRGEVFLAYEQAGYGVRFDYDGDLLPSTVIWISHCGRDEAPFDGQFRTLGIEATAGAFDLGSAVSASPKNPIAAENISTAITLTAGETLTTRYAVTLCAL